VYRNFIFEGYRVRICVALGKGAYRNVNQEGYFSCGGLGTRFLPVTKAQPKEMLPIVDKPAIQYVVEEAVQSGIDDFLFITEKTSGHWKTISIIPENLSTT